MPKINIGGKRAKKILMGSGFEVSHRQPLSVFSNPRTGHQWRNSSHYRITHCFKYLMPSLWAVVRNDIRLWGSNKLLFPPCRVAPTTHTMAIEECVTYIGIKLNGIITRTHIQAAAKIPSKIALKICQTLPYLIHILIERSSLSSRNNFWRDSHSTPKNNNIIISKWKRNEKRYVVDTSESYTCTLCRRVKLFSS